jgi:hypothetical protein
MRVGWNGISIDSLRGLAADEMTSLKPGFSPP